MRYELVVSGFYPLCLLAKNRLLPLTRGSEMIHTSIKRKPKAVAGLIGSS